MSVCIECVMTWLRFGDGAICLACRAPVVWKGKAKWSAASVSRAETIRRALRVNISRAEHEEVLAALDSLLDDHDRYREALTLLAGDEHAGSLAHTIAVAALYEEPARV